MARALTTQGELLRTALVAAAAVASTCSPARSPEKSPGPRPAPVVARIASFTGGVRVTTGEGRIDQLRGRGRVRTVRGETVDLDPNTGVTVDARGSAGPRRTLPRSPVLLSPAHQAELSYPDPASASTVLAWEAVPGAASYRLQLDDDGWFTDPLLDRKDIRGTSMTRPGLAAGKYYWRVSAVSQDGTEGSFSEFARFTVGAAAAGPPPALVVESVGVRRNILQIRGRKEPGASVTVNGQRVDVHKDGTFLEFITLEGAGEQKVRIKVRGASGRVHEEERTVVVAPF